MNEYTINPKNKNITVILCLPWLSFGGTEIQTLNLASALINQGYNVIVCCYYGSSEPIVNNFKKIGAKIELFSKDGRWLHGWAESLHLFKNFRRVCKLYKPDIAHVQYVNPGAKTCLVLKLLGIRRIIATFHTSADIYKNLYLTRFITDYILDVTICISQYAEKSFFPVSTLYDEKTDIKKHGHYCIYNALSDNIGIEQKPIENSREYEIGVISRLAEIKGMDLVVPAFRAVKQSIPNAKLLIVGDGPLKPLIKKQIKNYSLEDSVTLTGMIKHENISSQYDRIKILWVPSRSEGFGLSALEAMSRGCAVIASKVGGLPEVLANGAGLLSTSEDVEDFAQKTIYLLNNPNQHIQIVRKGIKRVELFSMERFEKLISSLYRKLKCLR